MAVIERSVPAQAAPGSATLPIRVRVGPAREALRIIASVAVVACAVLGAYLLATYPSEVHDRAAFNAAMKCGTAGADVRSCWTGVPGQVAAVDNGISPLGAHRTALLVKPLPEGPAQRIDVVRTNAFDCVHSGDAVDVKIWEGHVVSVLTPHGAVLTPGNMNVEGQAQLQAGATLMAIGLVVPTGLAIGRRRRRRGVIREPLGRVLRRPSAQLGLILFGAGQLADVITSAIGDYRGLYEANPLVADFVRAVGPAGFLLFRLPAIVLFLVGVWYLPRRVRLVVLYAAAAAFLYVGASNLHLVFASTSPTVCSVQRVL